MKSVEDPNRLLEAEEKLSESLRTALRAGRTALPTAEQLSDLSKRLAPMLPPDFSMMQPDSDTVAQSIQQTGTGFWLSKKLAVFVAITITAPALFYTWMVSDQKASEQTHPVQLEQPVSASDQAVSDIEVENPTPDKIENTPSAARFPVTQKPRTDLALRAKRSQEPSSPKDNSAKAETGYQFDEEFQLIRKARNQLRLAPRKALQLSELHRKQYPNGLFVQERHIIAIEALVRIGEIESAQQRAEVLYRAYPNTAYRRRIEFLLK